MLDSSEFEVRRVSGLGTAASPLTALLATSL